MKLQIKRKTRSWIIWWIANIFYLYEVILRVSPSVMTGELMSHYGITTSMLGILISFFYYSYTVLQIPCGLILDQIGSRNLIGTSIISSIIGSILFVATKQIIIAQIGRCLVGAGAACAFIASLQIASSLFPKKYFAIFAGITNTMGTVGAICGGFPIAKSVNAIGWQHTIFVLAFFGAILAMLAFIFIPKNLQIKEAKYQHKSLKSTLRRIITNKQIILSGFIGGFMYLPISVFSELWAVPFFMTKHNISNETASLASSTLFIGFAVGSLPLAIVAKKVGGYMKTIRFSIISITLLFFPLIYIDNISLSFMIVFLIGILTASEVMVFTCSKNNELIENAGTAIAFTNALVMLVGSVLQPLLGVLLDVFWTGQISTNGTRIYELHSYQNAILIIPACLTVAYILSIFMKETIDTENEFLEISN